MKKLPPINKKLKFKSWSYTRYQDHTECPRRAYYKHLERRRTAPSPAMERGTAVHKDAEDYLAGKLKRLPKELTPLKQVYAKIMSIGKRSALVMEQMWGHARDWKPVSSDDWDACWLRVKMDLVYLTDKDRILHVDDHKTGRIKDEPHRLQLSLYGVSALHRYPKVQEVHGRMLYVDHGKTSIHVVTRGQLKALTKEWDARTKPMFADKRFAPRPGNYCRWCDFSEAKGGPCVY